MEQLYIWSFSGKKPTLMQHDIENNNLALFYALFPTQLNPRILLVARLIYHGPGAVLEQVE